MFDEFRYFTPSDKKRDLFIFNNKNIDFLICEDMWTEDFLLSKKQEKLDLIIVINASPYEKGKYNLRKKIAAKRAKYFKAKRRGIRVKQHKLNG